MISIIGITAFVVLQIVLNNMVNSIWYIVLIAFIYAIYRRGYWISRRYYNLNVMKKDKIATTYSLLSIINEIAAMLAAYLGAILLDITGVKVVTILAMVIFFVSIIPLTKIECQKENKNTKIELKKHIKQIPKSNLYLFGSYELLDILNFVFTLYLFIYVKNTYETVGIVNLISRLAIIIFTYMYGKKLDATKKNLIPAAIILTVLVYIFKANTSTYILYILSFLEGIFTKMYEVSINKDFYMCSKNFEYANYNLVYETTQNLFRTLGMLILLIVPGLTIKTMIYIILMFMSIGAFFRFKPVKTKEHNM